MIISYDDDGRITCIQGIYPPTIYAMMEKDGTKYIERDIDDDAQVVSLTGYVDNGELYYRPAIPPVTKTSIKADGEDAVPIKGLPDPCTINVDGDDHTITGGHLDFQTETPGTYHLKIDHWPFLPWSAEIIAS